MEIIKDFESRAMQSGSEVRIFSVLHSWKILFDILIQDLVHFFSRTRMSVQHCKNVKNIFRERWTLKEMESVARFNTSKCGDGF